MGRPDGNSPQMIRMIRFTRYDAAMDLSGLDLISLAGASRQGVRVLVPAFRESTTMKKRWSFTRNLRAMNGEIADEVHEFLNATQGNFKLKQVLLRDGRVIELRYE
jgi:hypothetical protein